MKLKFDWYLYLFRDININKKFKSLKILSISMKLSVILLNNHILGMNIYTVCILLISSLASHSL